MLDFRHETFLALCRIGHYTKTAEALHITQPAVSQHIKYLEEYYGCKLFIYKDKTLTLTESGKKLQSFAMTMSADSDHLRNLMLNESLNTRTLRFGATLSIGEFVLPIILDSLLRDYPNIHITMPVDNTKVLLKKLCDGEIDFALIEGYFDKSEYGYKMFSSEEFVPVCGSEYNLPNKAVSLFDLLNERLIIRESGSGTRDVFEQFLRENNFSIKCFEKVCEIGNMSAIKHLVSAGLGITFLYRVAARRELSSGKIKELSVHGFPVRREFNFVWLKNSLHEQEYLAWLSYFMNIYTESLSDTEKT